MKIQQITIENFRSVAKTTIEPGNFNIFVGQNNHGKTNFFEAMKWFFTGKGSLSEIRRRGVISPILVDITYSEAQSGLDAMANATAKTKLTPFVNASDQVRVRIEQLKKILLKSLRYFLQPLKIGRNFHLEWITVSWIYFQLSNI